jgi:6-phosphofructokinase 1
MKRIGLLTGGGDVPPLNALIASVRDNAARIGMEALGFIKGWEGVLRKDFVSLSSIHSYFSVGGTVLKSSRTNIGRETGGIERTLVNLRELDIEALVVVGGEDTLSNAFLMKGFPAVLISKTIDNDVGIISGHEANFDPEKVINYFTLGFPTAAEKIVSFVSLAEGLRTTAYSHERIVIVESMGMSAGWLALAAGMGDPDMIVIPEFPLRYEGFLEKVIQVYEKWRNAVIVVAEGARWSDGSYVQAELDEGQGFDHPRFGGSAAVLASRLKQGLSGRFDTRNINAVNPSYLYRSGTPNALDRMMAEKLGAEAVKLIHEGIRETMFLAVRKESGGFGTLRVPLSRFASGDALHRFVDAGFYDQALLNISEDGRRYMKEIVREMPDDHDYGINRV